MALYILFFKYLFILSSLPTIKPIIKDLSFNEVHEEQFLPELTQYYIRFPSNFFKKFKFYINYPKTTNSFPVYSAEFSQYPTDSEINQKEFINELVFNNQEDPQYHKFTTEIEYKEQYIVIYFKNNEALNYLYLYAKTEIAINDIECNNKYEYENVNKETKLYFRVNIEDYPGEKITINLNYEDSDYNPDFNNYESNFNIDVETFKFYPEEGYLSSLDSLINNLNPEVVFNRYNNTDNVTMQYSFKPNNEPKYLIIQIETIKHMDFFSLVITPENNGKESSFPIWIIAIISIIALIIIFIIIAFVVIKTNGRYQSSDVCCLCCCVGICGALKRASK